MVCTRGVPFNAVRIGGIVTATIGSVERGPDQDLVTVTANDVERWRQEPAAWVAEYGDEVSRVRILVGERTIVGAVVMGDQDLAGPLLEMIKDEADVTPIRSAWQADPAQAVELLAGFYRERYGGPAVSSEIPVSSLVTAISAGV
jgi:hypothetical protein